MSSTSSLYPANTTEVIEIVNRSTTPEKWPLETTGTLRQRIQTKGIVNLYLHPRVYRLQVDKPVSKNKIVIKVYGMEGAQGLSSIPATVKKRGFHQKNSDNVEH